MERRDVLRIGAVVGVAVAFGWRATPTRIGDAPSSAPPRVSTRRPGSADRRPLRPARPDDDPVARGSNDRDVDNEQPSAEEPPPDDDAAADPQADEDPPAPEESGSDEPAQDPATTVEVICRDALGLAAAVGDARSHRLTRVTLHHSGVELGANRHAPARLRGHQRFHQDQGWSDIAYHIGVDAAGNVYELRDPSRAGDTFTDYDPTNHYLILCEGNYDIERPTDAMLDTVARVIADGSQRYGIDPSSLTGHRDHAGTPCPGEHLYRELESLARQARRYADTPVQSTAVCGDAGRDRVAAIEGA